MKSSEHLTGRKGVGEDREKTLTLHGVVPGVSLQSNNRDKGNILSQTVRRSLPTTEQQADHVGRLEYYPLPAYNFR